MLLGPRSLSRIACLASLFLAGCAGLSDLDAEFTGGLPAAGGDGGRAGASGGNGGASGGGVAGAGGRAGSSLGGRAGSSGAAGPNGGASGQTAGGSGSGQAGTSAGVGGVSASGAGGNAGNAAGSAGNVAGSSGQGGTTDKGGAGGASGGGGTAGLAGAGGEAGASGDGGSGGAGQGGDGGGAAGASSGSGGSETGGAAGSELGGASGTSGNGGVAGLGGGAGKAGGGGKAGASGAGTGGTGGSGAGSGSSGSGGQAGAGGSCANNDVDCDGITSADNCPNVANPSQSDQDSDKIGDACDGTPGGADATTSWDACGVGAGTPAVELLAVPAFSCVGSPFSVSYRVGGSVPCGSNVEFRAYRKSSGRLTSIGKIGETTVQSGSISLIGAVALSPGEWYLEAVVGAVASQRSRVTIGGAQVSLTMPRVATVEGGPVSITFGTSPSDPLAQYTMRVDDGAPSAAVSPAQVSFADPGDHEITVSAKTADGCTTTRSDEIEVFSCHPVLPPSTVFAPAPGNAKSVLVCGGASHTAGNSSASVYVKPSGNLIAGNGIYTVWLSPGATITSGQGILTLLYTGTKPTLTGSVRYLECKDIAFDEAALPSTCAAPP